MTNGLSIDTNLSQRLAFDSLHSRFANKLERSEPFVFYNQPIRL